MLYIFLFWAAVTPTSSWLADNSKILAHNEQAQLQICFPKMTKSGVAYWLCVNKALEFRQNSNRFVFFGAFLTSVNVALALIEKQKALCHVCRKSSDCMKIPTNNFLPFF